MKMHRPSILVFSAAMLLLAPALTQAAAEPTVDLQSGNAKSLVESLGLTALWSVVGTLLAIIGFKLFDRCTPGNLQREIIENKNVAAAIIGAAVIIGVCIIIAAAIIG